VTGRTFKREDDAATGMDGARRRIRRRDRERTDTENAYAGRLLDLNR